MASLCSEVEAIKIQGYLDKKKKKHFWRWWKKYWFVLEGKMLLRFRSKEEYECLGTCKGSIDMSLAQAVQASTSIRKNYPLEIITRTKVIHLLAYDEETRKKWLEALQNAIRLPQISTPIKDVESRSSNGTSSYPEEKITNVFAYDQSEKPSAEMALTEQQHTKETPLSMYLDYADRKNNINLTNASELKSLVPERTQIKSRPIEDRDSQSSNDSVFENPLKISNAPGDLEEDCFKSKHLNLYEEIIEEVIEFTRKSLEMQNFNKIDQSKKDSANSNAEGIRSGEKESFTNSPKECINEKVNVYYSVDDKLNTKLPLFKLSKQAECTYNISLLKETLINNSENIQPPEGNDLDGYYSASESCYVTAESSDVEDDVHSVDSQSSATFPNAIQSPSGVYLNLTDSSHTSRDTIFTNKLNQNEETMTQTSNQQYGSLCNMLDVTDDENDCVQAI